jgi:hypothetical protein
MENGDIADFYIPTLACVFENLLAAPPITVADRLKYKLYVSRNDWDSAIKLWQAHSLPVKSLIDAVNRRGISTQVITFLSSGATDPIYRWLLRKGVTTVVDFYDSVESYAADLHFNRAINTVFVPSKEMAYKLGMRATTASTTTVWTL